MTKKIAKPTKTKTPAKNSGKLIDLNISPSKAYLATQCMKWQSIKSGNKLLATAKNAQDGIDKHAAIEKDISIVKNWLPENWQKMEVYQEYPLERVIDYKNFRLKISGKADACIRDTYTVSPNGSRKLYLFDWKTGGSDVSDIQEEQLILYAFCALDKFKDFCESVELVYVNPEMNSSMTRNYTPLEIEQKVFDLIETVGRKLSEGYTIGEHCQYCPARSACPELLKQLKLLISPEVNGQPIENFSEIQLDLIKVADKVVDELKKRLKSWLVLNPDKSLHGYTLANRAGIREFRIDAEMQIIAETLGVGLDDLFEKKVKSVKKLEDAGLGIEKVQDFIFQPVSKVLKKVS